MTQQSPPPATVLPAPPAGLAAWRERWAERLRASRALKVVGGLLAVSLVISVVPPLRAVASDLGGRVLYTTLSPVAPDVSDLEPLAEASEVLAADGSTLARLHDGEERRAVSLDEVPEHVQQAVLAAEDKEFYHHDGIDPSAVVRAAVRTVRGDLQGGSTITQQLAKINYTDRSRTVGRKMSELLYTVALEREYTKDELLERYLNQVYFGDGAYGIALAARTYFDREVEELTVAQAAMLAGKIQAPEGFDPVADPDAVQARRDDVLRAMASEGWLDDAELEAALAEPLGVVAQIAEPTHTVNAAPHFVAYVVQEIDRLSELGPDVEARRRRLYAGGLTIETTLAPAAQQAAEAAVVEELTGEDVPASAAVSVEPADGAIRALFGGLDFDQQQFDPATQARRQPGSAFKPFVYLAALGQGVDPRSRMDGSSPRTFTHDGETFEVSNYDSVSAGRITIDEALRRSINTVFMDLGLAVGPEAVVRTAARLGLPDDIGPVPAVSLGGIDPGVTPLQLAAAYATFASGGLYAEPYAIARIRDREGRVIYEADAEAERVIDEREAGVLNASLRQVVRSGTGRGAAIGRDVAGKTGTTSDHRDALFVGYTPQLSTAVWIGHLDNRPMDGRYTGGSVPAAIFARLMRAAHADLEVRSLPVASPDDLDLRPLEGSRPTTSSRSRSTSSTTSSSTTSTTGPESSTTTVDDSTSSTETSQPEATTTTSEPEPTTTEPAPTTTAAESGGGGSGGEKKTSTTGSS